MVDLEQIKKISLLLDSERLEEAKRALDISINQDPKEIRVHYLLGIYHLRKEQFSLAIPHFLYVWQSKENPGYLLQTLKLLSYCYLKIENFEKARDIIKLSINNFQNDLELKNMFAYSYYCLDEIKEALKLYGEVLDKDKKNVTALNAVSYCLCDIYDKPLDAIKLLEPYLNEDPRILDTLGWAYYKIGEVEKAEEYLRRAFDKNPGNNIIKNHITTIVATSN